MARPVKYPAELRERAVRMVIESRADHVSEFQAMRSVAGTLGIGSAETVRKWRNRDHVEINTLDWAHWSNTERPHESIDDMTPALVEQFHYDTKSGLAETG